MVGREVQLVVDRGVSHPGRRRSSSCPTCGSTTTAASEVVRGVNLEVRAGEILGIAGVAGNGQDELVEALTGLRKPDRAGPSRLAGSDVTGCGAATAARGGARASCPATATASALVLSFPLDGQPRPDPVRRAAVRPRPRPQRRGDRRTGPSRPIARVRHPDAVGDGPGRDAVRRQPAEGRRGARVQPQARSCSSSTSRPAASTSAASSSSIARSSPSATRARRSCSSRRSSTRSSSCPIGSPSCIAARSWPSLDGATAEQGGDRAADGHRRPRAAPRGRGRRGRRPPSRAPSGRRWPSSRRSGPWPRSRSHPIFLALVVGPDSLDRSRSSLLTSSSPRATSRATLPFIAVRRRLVRGRRSTRSGGHGALNTHRRRRRPLVLGGLAVGVGFKAGLFNIGGQGQFLARRLRPRPASARRWPSAGARSPSRSRSSPAASAGAF